MKTCFKLTIIFLLGALLSSACNNNKTKDVKKEVNEAVDETKNFISDEYDELLSNIDNFITEKKKTIDTYKIRVEKMDEKIKNEFNIKLSNLEADRKKLEQKKEEYKNLTTEKKDSVKEEIINLKDALEKSIKKFETELKEKEDSRT